MESQPYCSLKKFSTAERPMLKIENGFTATNETRPCSVCKRAPKMNLSENPDEFRLQQAVQVHRFNEVV